MHVSKKLADKAEVVANLMRSRGIDDATADAVLKVAAEIGLDMVENLTPSQFINYLSKS